MAEEGCDTGPGSICVGICKIAILYFAAFCRSEQLQPMRSGLLQGVKKTHSGCWSNP